MGPQLGLAGSLSLLDLNGEQSFKDTARVRKLGVSLRVVVSDKKCEVFVHFEVVS